MLNLFDFHNDPSVINGYHTRHLVDVKTAYNLLVGKDKAGTSASVEELEHEIANDAHYAYEYAKHINGRFPAGERAIAASAYAYDYAVNVINDRFPLGEPEILKSLYNSHNYLTKFITKLLSVYPEKYNKLGGEFWRVTIRDANDPIKGIEQFIFDNDQNIANYGVKFFSDKPWKDFEPYIHKLEPSRLSSIAYIAYKARIPSLEPAILKNLPLAVIYHGRNMGGAPWPELDHAQKNAVVTTPEQAYNKAKIIGPDPKLEKLILQDQQYTTWYAMNILGRRWPEAEPSIKTSDYYWTMYTRNFPDAK